MTTSTKKFILLFFGFVILAFVIMAILYIVNPGAIGDTGLMNVGSGTSLPAYTR